MNKDAHASPETCGGALQRGKDAGRLRMPKPPRLFGVSAALSRKRLGVKPCRSLRRSPAAGRGSARAARPPPIDYTGKQCAPGRRSTVVAAPVVSSVSAVASWNILLGGGASGVDSNNTGAASPLLY